MKLEQTMYYKLLLFSLCILIFGANKAQDLHVIPAFTGYATPAESWSSKLFDPLKGVSNWTNLQQQLAYHFYLRKTGSLELSMQVRNPEGASQLQVLFDKQAFTVNVPKSDKFVLVKLGKVSVKDTGFHVINIKGLRKSGKSIAEIAGIVCKGPATEGMHFNQKERRNAASVHLRYSISDTTRVIAFYNELTVPAGADQVHSYYMANGFARGYFGIQVNSEKERRIIFSIWDAGNEAVDRGKVADSNRVQLLAKGDGVVANDFGNEGTGGHSHWVYPWKAGQTYKFLVTALTDSASNTTIYSGYCFLPDVQQWKLIAAFKAPKDGKWLRNLYSFNENFVGVNGQLQRRAHFGNQWIQRENGSWQELTNASFSYDATGKAGDRIDYGAGVQDGQFYLWNGGFEAPTAVYGQTFSRPLLKTRPNIDWSKNADSAVQMAKDYEQLNKAIQAKTIDTTGSIDGIYYKILKEGTGAFVNTTDTVSIFYKGWLFKDGLVFDQTKDKPANFPLKRLIKGWQLGLQACKVGGKIRLYIPSVLAYGMRTRSKDIAPNQILVFDIEVLSAKK
jgi:FKBP-type peptidyl-prolyl cis-trans isomerase